ncbi:hypothetical protein ACJQWK_05965 [Exserohilum turcicum]
MDPQTLHTLMTTVQSVEASLDTAPDSWPQHLEAIRSITAVFEITDTRPDDARRRWQLPLIRLAQRVAFADADHGPTTDMADWCLRQLLTLLPVYPNNVEILACQLHHAQLAASPLFEAQERLNGAHYVEARALLLPAIDYLERAVGAAKAQGSLNRALLSLAAEAFMSLGNVTSPRVHTRYFRHAMAHLRSATDLDGYALPVHLQQ